MKILKIIGIVIVALVLIIIALGLIAPKSYDVERSIVINAPKDLVFRQMQFWNNWGSWSPWAEKDSTMKITVEGLDGQKDSKYIWEGDPEKTGSGEMTNTGITPNEEMTYHLYFATPYKSHSDGYVRVSDTDNGTKASWGFYGKYPFPWNIMLLFMPMEKMIGPDFERGMELLKEVVETKASKLVSLKVEEVKYKSTTYAAIRQHVKMSDIASFFETSFASINKAMEASGAKMTGAPAGIYFEWDEKNGVTDMAAAIPMRGKVTAGEVEMINVPGANALAINYRGPYDQVELAHLAMAEYIKANQVPIKSPVLEEYLTDPASMADPNNWLTRVVYLTE